MYRSDNYQRYPTDFQNIYHASNDEPLEAIERPSFSERTNYQDRGHDVSMNNHVEQMYMDRRTVKNIRAVATHYNQQDKTYLSNGDYHRSLDTLNREHDKKQKYHSAVEKGTNQIQGRYHPRTNENERSTLPLLFSFGEENDSFSRHGSRSSSVERSNSSVQPQYRYNSHAQDRVFDKVNGGRVKETFENTQETSQDNPFSQFSQKSQKPQKLSPLFDQSQQLQIPDSHDKKEDNQRNPSDLPLYEDAKLLAEMSALAHNEVKERKDESFRKSYSVYDENKERSDYQGYTDVMPTIGDNYTSQATVVTPKSSSNSYGSQIPHYSSNFYNSHKFCSEKRKTFANNDKTQRTPARRHQYQQYKSHQTYLCPEREHYIDDRYHPTLNSSKSFDEYNLHEKFSEAKRFHSPLRGKEHNRDYLQRSNDPVYYSPQYELSARNNYNYPNRATETKLAHKHDRHSIECSQSFPPANTLPVLPKLSNTSYILEEVEEPRRHRAIFKMTDDRNFEKSGQMRQQPIPVISPRFENETENHFYNKLHANEYNHNRYMMMYREDEFRIRTRHCDRGRVPPPKSRRRAVKAILRKKFTWKHYPEVSYLQL